ncbi:MAG: lipopolysaccharide heptosyltransferase I [Burkholderiales bacterium]|nr:lipopolysaccharide heptosyltransferase I [Burkholderiales bacterium]
MPEILLVKTSSLGDVVHNLPVASDIRRHVPAAAIDWVVEEAYAPLVRLHPAVREAIPVAIRRWRRHLGSVATWRELARLRGRLRERTYDAVIDTQGLVKSALIVRRARGTKHGYSAATVREPLAARAYDVTHDVPRGAHAVERNRQLAAAALGYRLDGAPDYGLRITASPPVAVAGRYSVLLHATSRADKLWPEARWQSLGVKLASAGLTCVLPWGSVEELERSRRLAAAIPGAIVPPAMALDAAAALLAHAAAVVGVDTGLVHLAVAAGAPTVAVFAGSDPALTGVYGSPRARNVGGPGASPAVEEVVATLRQVAPGLA